MKIRKYSLSFILLFLFFCFQSIISVNASELTSVNIYISDTSFLTIDDSGNYWLDDSDQVFDVGYNSSSGNYETYTESTIIYRLSISVEQSESEVCEAGDLSITIPNYLFSSRSGGDGNLSVSASLPDKDSWSSNLSDFYYTYDDDGNYAITNGIEIVGTYESVIEFSYTGTYFCQDIVSGSKSTDDSVIITVNSETAEISLPDVYYKSSVEIEDLSGTSEVYYVYPEDFEEIEPEDADYYIWTVSTFSADFLSNTQAADINIEGSCDDEGIIYAVEVSDDFYGSGEIYVLTKYPKSTVQDEAIHNLSTSITVTLTGKDDEISSSASATADTVYEYTNVYYTYKSVALFEEYPSTNTYWKSYSADTSEDSIWVSYTFLVYFNLDSENFTYEPQLLITDGTIFAESVSEIKESKIYNTGSSWTYKSSSSYTSYPCNYIEIRYLVRYQKSVLQDLEEHTLSMSLTSSFDGIYNGITSTSTSVLSTTYKYESIYVIDGSASLYYTYPSSSIWADYIPENDDEYFYATYTFDVYLGLDVDMDTLVLEEALNDYTYGTLLGYYVEDLVSGTVYLAGDTFYSGSSPYSSWDEYTSQVLTITYLVQYDPSQMDANTWYRIYMTLEGTANSIYNDATDTAEGFAETGLFPVLTYPEVVETVEQQSSYTKAAGMSPVYPVEMTVAEDSIQIVSSTSMTVGEATMLRGVDTGTIYSISGTLSDYQVNLEEGIPYYTLSNDSDADPVYFDNYEYSSVEFTLLPKVYGYDDEMNYTEQYAAFTVYCMYDDEYVEYCTVEDGVITYTDGTTETFSNRIEFPSGTKQFLISYTCEDYFSSVKYTSEISLLYSEENLEYLSQYKYVWQIGTVSVSDYSDTDKDYDRIYVSSSEPDYSITGTVTNDDNNQTSLVEYTVVADSELTNITAQIASYGYGSYDKEGTLYVLLPNGSVFSSVSENYIKDFQANDISFSYIYSVTTNWRDTGRTMVEINYDCDTSFPYAVSFIVSCYYPYSSINDYGSSLYASSMIYLEDADSLILTTNMSDNSGGELEDAEAFSEIYDDSNIKYLYTSTTNAVSVTYTSILSLYERVWDGTTWTTGISEDVEIGRGVSYCYQLHFGSSLNTYSKDNILYTNLETYGDSEWHGYLDNIDTSQVETLGADPVIYYSVEEIDLDSEEDRDLSNSDIWTTELPEDTSQITAIAIDLSKTSDGKDFILEELQTVNIIINMISPDENEIASGAAYSNVYLTNTLLDTSGNVSVEDNFSRYNYVKVVIADVDNATLSIDVQKLLDDPLNTGKELSAGDFEFMIYDENGEEVGTAVNDENGIVTFDIYIASTGEHSYRIVEKTDDDKPYEYSQTEITVNILVENNGEEYLITEINVEISDVID